MVKDLLSLETGIRNSSQVKRYLFKVNKEILEKGVKEETIKTPGQCQWL